MKRGKKKGMGKLRLSRRKSIRVTPEQLVKTGLLPSGNPLPLVIEPTMDGVDLVAWGKKNLNLIEDHLLQHGGILFRNFNVKGVEQFQDVVRATTRQELLEYTYRSTPRSQVSGKIYTSTEYPADQAIPMHNEHVYDTTWPMKIWFFCVKAAEEQGQTPIADSRKVFERINPTIKEQFMQKKVMYVRNYGELLDLPWQDVFQTTEKSAVEQFCHHANIEFEWLGENLRTRQVCQAVAKHPRTGEMVWCNQAHLFHVSSLHPTIRDSLLSVVDEEGLPRNAYYGDGSPIEPAALDEIRAIYQQEMVLFPWQEGDVLILDNMLTAHGRMPYKGTRKIVVGMAESYSLPQPVTSNQ